MNSDELINPNEGCTPGRDGCPVTSKPLERRQNDGGRLDLAAAADLGRDLVRVARRRYVGAQRPGDGIGGRDQPGDRSHNTQRVCHLRPQSRWLAGGEEEHVGKGTRL